MPKRHGQGLTGFAGTARAITASFLWGTAAVLALGVPSLAPADNINGAFGPVTDWPLIPIHAALTPDGRVLTYGTDGSGKQTGYFIYDVWDPSLGFGPESHLTLSNLTQTDIFCSSQVILPSSGDIFIAGGDNWTGTRTTNTGNNNSNLFNPDSNSLTRQDNMNRPRWYSSSTVLMNGDIYVQGGSGGADLPEVRNEFGGFRLLSTAPTNGLAALFPRNFLAPDGRVFGYDTNGRMYYVDTAGTGSLVRVGQFASSNAGWTSSAAMYRPGRILQVGGNSNGAVVIDINAPVPSVTTTGTMNSMPGSTRRQWVSATVLPNGRVLATGGSNRDNRLELVNNTADIWDPDTGQWTSHDVGELARLYHSSALLLPDATVMVGGGGAPGPLVNTNVEIYYPPYLYDESGSFAPRPEIVSAPFTVQPGSPFQIEMAADDASRVTLVKSGSVTHSVNMDQRFIELPFEKAGNLLTASLPSLMTETPPGFYMLFVLNSEGVPSEARILRIDIPANPSIALDYTPAIGGAGGTAFQLVCAPDEVLVGAYGTVGTYVNQIGPRCVRVDQFGQWIGDPLDGALTGSNANGTPFVRTCPRDMAVSGFRGRGSQYVDQIDLECRALTGDGTLAGDGEFTGGFGGAGGTDQGPYACGTGNPAYAFYGRSGGWLDQFGIECRQAPITPISVNSAPSVTNPGGLVSVLGASVDVAILATDPDDDPLTFSAEGLPDGLNIAAATGRITGVPAVADSFAVIVAVSDGTAATEVEFTWLVEDVPTWALRPITPQPAVETGTTVTFTASAENGINPRYKWLFDDGSPETEFSTDPVVSHAYSAPGVYYVTVTVTDDRGVEAVATVPQVVHLPLSGNSPSISGNVDFRAGPGWWSCLGGQPGQRFRYGIRCRRQYAPRGDRRWRFPESTGAGTGRSPVGHQQGFRDAQRDRHRHAAARRDRGLTVRLPAFRYRVLACRECRLRCAGGDGPPAAAGRQHRSRER